MSATLKATSLAAGHGARVLFSGLDLVIGPGDVVGLVGVNGAGKSTLLRMLAGETAAEAGTITLSPPDATVGLLPQEPERRAGETVAAFLARRTGVAAAQVAMDSAAADLAAGAPGDTYAAALDRWLALGGADLDERIGEVAAELGLGVGLDMPMTGLSGGQAARVGLAALLLSRFDVLLLDEPTNDLDLDGLARLERFVLGLRSAAVIVSHDREFLARTVNRIVELDLAQQKVGVYDGGYESYLMEREVARRHAREEYEEYDDRLGSLKDRAQTQRNWMAQGVRNARRKATDNDKFVRKFRAETSEKQAAKARQTQRAIERLGGGGGAAQGVGAADDDRRGAALGHGGGVGDRGGGAAGQLHARAGGRAGRLGGPGGDHRAQRLGQDHAARRAARAGSRSIPDRRGWGRACGWARSTRRAGCSSAPIRWQGRSGTPCRAAAEPAVRRTGRSRTCAPCWPSSASPATRPPGPRGRCRRANAPGRRWRCCRPVR